MTIVVANQSFQGASGRFYDANQTLIDDSHEDYVAAPAYFDEFVGFFNEYPDASGHADGEVLTLTSEVPGWEAPTALPGGSQPDTVTVVDEVLFSDFVLTGPNEIQTVDITGAASGHYQLLDPNTSDPTGNIQFNASANDVKTALEALPSIGAGNVQVSLAAQVYTVEFIGDLEHRVVYVMGETQDTLDVEPVVSEVQTGGSTWPGQAPYRTIAADQFVLGCVAFVVEVFDDSGVAAASPAEIQVTNDPQGNATQLSNAPDPTTLNTDGALVRPGIASYGEVIAGFYWPDPDGGPVTPIVGLNGFNGDGSTGRALIFTTIYTPPS